CAQKKRVFLCTHGSLTDPAATGAGRAKSRSKKLCKFVHYCAAGRYMIFAFISVCSGGHSQYPFGERQE
ncbi:hypothetical protein ACI1JV_005060, partial [Escherichia coli]